MTEQEEPTFELSTSEAGQILNISSRTINRYVKRGLLIARLQGVKQVMRIDLADLRTFSERYGFVVHEAVVEEITAARQK